MALQTVQSTVTEVSELAPQVFELRLEVPDTYHFASGQYIFADFEKDGQRILRPYSLAAPPKKGELALCIKRVPQGIGSNYLCDLKEGATLKVSMPQGHFSIVDPDEQMIFLATGSGIAPFMSMIPTALESGKSPFVHLLVGFRTESDIFYEERLKALKKHYKNFSYTIVLSDAKSPQHPKKGWVQDHLKDILPTDFNGHFYLCGVKDMVTHATEKIKALGFSEKQIVLERYN